MHHVLSNSLRFYHRKTAVNGKGKYVCRCAVVRQDLQFLHVAVDEVEILGGTRHVCDPTAGCVNFEVPRAGERQFRAMRDELHPFWDKGRSPRPVGSKLDVVAVWLPQTISVESPYSIL